MIANYSGELFILGGIFLTAVLGWVGTVIAKKMRPRASEPEMWRRLDELSIEVYGDETRPGLKVRVEVAERKSGAAGRVIRDLARQWPHQHTPRLNPADLDELDEDTIPINHPWRFKP